jgi:hypothetical protein
LEAIQNKGVGANDGRGLLEVTRVKVPQWLYYVKVNIKSYY